MGLETLKLGGAAIATGFRGRGPRPDNRRIPVARINERIRVPQVRVIGDEGEQLGVMDIRDAIRTAREKGLDLVEVAATADPPVCRIIDFGKFQYEAKKKANEAKKKQSVIVVKEVKFRPGTDDHDYDYRMKHAREWLQEGDKVKATIWFRGREMTHRELGARILEKSLKVTCRTLVKRSAAAHGRESDVHHLRTPASQGSREADRPAPAKTTSRRRAAQCGLVLQLKLERPRLARLRKPESRKV